MAIIRLDCNLNGGDSVTPNNELFYRIYGDVDAYTSPIHTTGTALSDANVTVDNDKVIITGVDGATNVRFKIAAVDGAGNEGVLSDALSSGFKLVMTNSVEYLAGFGLIDFATDGDYLEIKLLWHDSTVSQYILGANTGPKVLLADTGSYTWTDDGSVNNGSLSGYPPEGSYVLGTVKFLRNGTDMEGYWNGALLDSITLTGDFNFSWIGRFSSAIWKAEVHDFTLKRAGVDEYFACNEGSGSEITGDQGTIGAIGGYVDDSVWVAL